MKWRGVTWLILAVVIFFVPAHARPPHGGVSGGGGSGLTLLSMEDGFQGAAFSLGGNGTFTGSAPASMTATASGCGGGSLTVNTLVTPSYGAGTYQVLVAMPSASGTNCTITVTDNLSRTATSPPFKVLSSTPGSTATANVHNAPGWLPSHSYTFASGPKNRVLNGAGWSGSAFIPGSALNAYEQTSAGTCTSASSGGPSGTGASISDGTCTWKYLSGVDYITLTGWALDAPLWSSGVTYTYFQTMTINDGGTLRAYELDGTTPAAFCTSTVAPTGTGSAGGLWSTGEQVTSDGCIWDYLGDVTYSSRVASIPTQTYVNNGFGATSHLDRAYTALLWNDAEYVAGSGGERNPIGPFNHFGNAIILEGNLQGPDGVITITTAAGESFMSSLTTSTPLAGYDVTKGVSIRNANATGAFPAAPNFNFGPSGLFSWDSVTTVNGLQIKSTAGPGLYGINGDIFTNNIIDGGWNNGGSNNAWCMAVWMDNESDLVNNLILSHGCIGVGFKYGNSFALFNTVVNVGAVSNTSGFAYGWSWVFQDVALANNAVSGFAHVAAEDQGVGPSPINSRSVGNVTTVASPDNTGTSWWVDQTANHSNVTAVPGTTFGVTAASMFIAPGTDYRPNTGLSTAGASFGNFNQYCVSPFTSGCVVQNFDTPDILGNTRPNGSAQWSTGAEQHP